jgi:hypothetical protein
MNIDQIVKDYEARLRNISAQANDLRVQLGNLERSEQQLFGALTLAKQLQQMAAQEQPPAKATPFIGKADDE